MALMVSDEARLWFLIVTGDEFPDANEDSLRALCAAWRDAASGLRRLALDLRRAVASVRDGFQGQAAEAFAAVMRPFVDGPANYVDTGAVFFDELGEMLCELALDVEYLKYVVILELSLLAAEFAWASAMSAFFGPVPMIWFGSRLQMVRRTFKRLMAWFRSRLSFLDKIGAAGRAFLAGMVFSMGNQMAVAAGAQAIQFAQHKRDHLTREYLSNAAVVGAVGGFLALPMSALGHRVGRTLANMLDSVFGRAHSFRDWHKAFADGLAHVLHESLHEGSTATISTAILTHQFAANWADFTAGASSGVARVAGHLFGHIILKLANLAGTSLIAQATHRAVKKRLANGGGHGDDIEYKPVPVPRSYNSLPGGPRGDAPADGLAERNGPPAWRAQSTVDSRIPGEVTPGSLSAQQVNHGRNPSSADSLTERREVTQGPPRRGLAQQPLGQPLAQQGLAQQRPPQTDIGKAQLEPKATAPELTSGPSRSQQQVMPVTASAGQSVVTPAQQVPTGATPDGRPKSWAEVGKLADHIEQVTEGQLSRSTTRMEEAKQIVRQTFRVGRLNAKQLDALTLVVAYRRLHVDKQTTSQYAAYAATDLGVPSSRWLNRLRFPGGATEAAGLSHEDSTPYENAYLEEIQATAEAAEDAAVARDATAVAVGRTRFARAKAERELTEAVESLRVATSRVNGTEVSPQAAREVEREATEAVEGARRALTRANDAHTAAVASLKDADAAATAARRTAEAVVRLVHGVVTEYTDTIRDLPPAARTSNERTQLAQRELTRIAATVKGYAGEAAGALDAVIAARSAAETSRDEAASAAAEAAKARGADQSVAKQGRNEEEPFAEELQDALDAAESAAIARGAAASAEGRARYALAKAERDLADAIESLRVARGGVIGTEAARELGTRREANAWASLEIARVWGETDVEESQRRLRVAEAYAQGTELSAEAAREAERKAADAVERARRAVTAAQEAHAATVARRDETGAAAETARRAAESVATMVRDARSGSTDAGRVFAAASSTAENLTEEIEDIERRIVAINHRTGDAEEQFAPAGPPSRTLSGTTISGLSRVATGFSDMSGSSEEGTAEPGHRWRTSTGLWMPSGFRRRPTRLSRTSTGLSGDTLVSRKTSRADKRPGAFTTTLDTEIVEAEEQGPDDKKGLDDEKGFGDEKGLDDEKGFGDEKGLDDKKGFDDEKGFGDEKGEEVAESGGRKGKPVEEKDEREGSRARIADSVRSKVGEAIIAVTAAEAARSAAETSRDKAEAAAGEVKKAKGEAGDFAAQGLTEAMFTLLSSVPPGTLLAIEHVGSLDGLAAALAAVTGREADDVGAEIAALGGEGLVKAMNERKLTIGGRHGPVTLDLVATELSRPADSRTKPPDPGRPSVLVRHGAEQTIPHTDGASRSVPIRIPLMVAEPITSALSAAVPAGLVRPLVFFGATGRGNRKFDSSSSVTRDRTSTDRAAIDTALALTFRGRDGKPVVATVDVGVRVATVVRGTAEPHPLSEAAVAELRRRGVSLPDELGTGPQVSYVGTSPGWEIKTTKKQSRALTNTGGSDGVGGAGVYGGMEHDWGAWFVGVFGEIGNGLAGGVNRVLDREQVHNAVNQMLIYRIDPGTGKSGARSPGYAVVPAHAARAAGLPLPEHLQGSKKVTGNGARRYVVGTDEIMAVPGAGEIAELASRGLSQAGREAVEAAFGDPDLAHLAISDAMYGGHQVTWTEEGREHTVDIYAVAVPPTLTEPSGLTKIRLEDKTTIQSRRVTASHRFVRAGFGGEAHPVFHDNPDARKPPPEPGDPDPYQGAGTTSRNLPAGAVTGNWENTRINRPGRIGKDGRTSTFKGEFRDWKGAVDLVVVHSSTPLANRLQRWVFGGMMTSFGDGWAGRRLAEPPREPIDKAFDALGTGDEPASDVWLPNPGDTTAGLVRGRVDNAIEVAVPADKVGWASAPLPESTMTPGLYLGTPPPMAGDAKLIDPAALGPYAAVEDVHVSRNHIEAVQIALAKRVFPLSGPGKASRESPFLGGTWPSPGTRRFTDTRTEEGRETSTTYWYKMSSLMRLNNAARHAISQVLGRVSARGITALGLNGQSSGTGEMVRGGRLSDLTGQVDVKQAYSAPRLLGVRDSGRLQRNQNGETAVSAGLNRGRGVAGRLGVSVVPKRSGKWGAILRTGFVASVDKVRGHTEDVAPGNKQSGEYRGPTAFLVLDTRTTFSADMKIRNLVHTSTLDELPVTVHQPNGTLVQLPALTAVELYESLNLPVPPELAAAAAAAKRPDPKAVPAQTLIPKPGEYTSHNGTNVVGSVLHGDDPLAGVRARLDELGVKGEWRQRVLDDVEELLTTPFGYVELRNVLFGSDPVPIQVSDSDMRFDDVVDIRISAVRSERAPESSARPTLLPPSELTNVGYLTTSHLDQTTKVKHLEVPFETGFVNRSKAPTPPAQPGPEGTLSHAEPGAAAPQGSYTPQPMVGRVSRRQVIEPASLNRKSTSQMRIDKVASDHVEVSYSLVISRRRRPMPGFETMALGLPALKDWDRETTEAVVMPGAVDLFAPDQTVAPPLPRPRERPTIEVIAARPRRELLFHRDDGFHPEAIGRYTIEAVRKAVFALFSAKPPPRGVVPAGAVERAVAAKSAYTREGGAAEYVLNLMTSGTSLHGGLHAMATGDDYRARNVLAAKHVPFDKLFDLKLTLDYRSFEIVKEPPEGVTVEMFHDLETSTPHGESKVVAHLLGETNPGMASGDIDRSGDGEPGSLRAVPRVGVMPGHDRYRYALAGKTSQGGNTKYSGRFYLAKASGDIYVETSRHKSNRVADLFSSPDRVAVVRSKEDLYVRIHEDLGLSKGILTIGDVWSFNGKEPGDGLVVRTTRDGAEIGPASDTKAREVPAARRPHRADADEEKQGRTLHIKAGTELAQVVEFVRSLPADMRPANYTVGPGVSFTPEAVRSGVTGKEWRNDPDLAELVSSDGDSDFGVATSEEGDDVGASLPGGSLLTDVHGLPEALAFDKTWDGAPPVASALVVTAPGSGEPLANRAPVFTGKGGKGLVAVAGRLTEPGARAVVWVLSDKTSDLRSGRAVNLVRSGDDLFLVDVPTKTFDRMTVDDLREVGDGLGPVYALVSDGEGHPLPAGKSWPPVAPGKDADPFDIAVYQDDKRKYEMGMAAENGEDISLPGGRGRLVQWLGGLRLVASVVMSPAFVAELSATLARDVIALVIGPSADDPPRWLLFPPSGHPLPVKPEDLPPQVQALL